MFGKIRHIAMYTHNHAAVDQFYQQVFGMRRMTSNTLDETGKQNASRGHISDGVIGLAILVALCRHAVRHGSLWF